MHITADFSCAKYEVLATNRLSYDATEIRQINDYYSATSRHPVALPSTLRLVEGGAGSQFDAGCKAEIGLTNTSSSTIQVERVGVELLARPQPNTYSYRLIDFCSLTGIDDYFRTTSCPVGHGATPICSIYTEDVPLSNGANGAIYDGIPSPVYATDREGVACSPQINLAPTDADSLTMYLTAANFRFIVALHLTLLTASGEKTVTLSQNPTDLTFAIPSQFSCYKLNGTMFTLAHQGKEALDDPQELPPGTPHWNCVHLTLV